MTDSASVTAHGAAITAERKVLTLLFVDLSGYTRLSTTRDPEDVLVTVGPLLNELRGVAEDHGGYVPAVQGDGFLSIFGAPTSHSDDPQRAVAAAQTMRAVVQRRRANSTEVPDVHVGVATGETLVTAHPDRYDVIGAAVNLASRLSDAAGPGEVLVDESSAALTADDALYGSARTLTLAGFAGAVRALPLVGVGRQTGSRGAAVGRDSQLLVLERAYEAALASRSSVTVAVSGEAGAGKTQLVEAWVAQHPEALILRGYCRPYGSPLPLSALSEAVARLPEQTVESELPGPRSTAEDYRRLLPQQRSATSASREPDAALALAARAVLEELSRREPTVLILEDVHWADESLLEVLRSLHAIPVGGALTVVATSRDPVADLPHLSVPSLSVDDVAQVVHQRVGALPDAALLNLLVERSAGNPLWLVECLRLLSDRGQLAIEGDRAVARDWAGGIEVPESIRMIVSARLDSLPGSRKAALQHASVWPADIEVNDWPGDREEMSDLVILGLLERLPGDLVRFSHGLVREAIYRSMPRAVRVTEHESLLARTSDPAVRAYAALEVQRLDVAPDSDRRRLITERALDAVTAHAQHLRRSHARAARDVLLRVSDLVAEVEVVAPRASAALLTELAEVHRDLEDGAQSREAAVRAATLASLASDDHLALRAQLALGEALLGTDDESARAAAERVLATGGADDAARGRAWILRGGSHAYDDAAQLLYCLQQAFACYNAADEVANAADCARRLAFNLSVTADARFDHWLDVATTMTPADHLRGQGELALIRAVVAQARGLYEVSWAAATAAIALTERVGMHQFLVNGVAVAVEVATASGRRSALPGLLARLGSLIEGHRSRLQVTGLCASAPGLMLLGRNAESERALERAQSLLPSVGANEATMFWAAKGHAAALAERHSDAEDAYGRAEELARALGLMLFADGCQLQRLLEQASGPNNRPVRADLLTLARRLDAAGATPLAESARTLGASLAS